MRHIGRDGHQRSRPHSTYQSRDRAIGAADFLREHGNGGAPETITAAMTAMTANVIPPSGSGVPALDRAKRFLELQASIPISIITVAAGGPKRPVAPIPIGRLS
jgi:hypothetical protein